MRTRFIFNPCSGHNRRDPWLLDELRSRVARNSKNLSLRLTEGPRHATQLAREALGEKIDRVVAVGGDGTLNEVAQALVHAETSLGLVPCGSGNGLALHLGIPTKPIEALDLVTSEFCRELSIDTGDADGHFFCNVMGIGLDAEISERFNRLTGRGFANYVRTTLSTLRHHAPMQVTVLADNGEQFELSVSILAVANSDQYGNRAYIAPGAKSDDGLLDLTALKPSGLLQVPSLAFRLFRGTLNRSPRVHTLRARGFTIHRNMNGPLHTDGETHLSGSRIRVDVRPTSLRVLLPPIN